MPRKYEAMRDKFKAAGMSEDAAQERAAKIYNAQKKPGDPALHHSPYAPANKRNHEEVVPNDVK